MVYLLVAMLSAQCGSNSAGQFKEGIQKNVLWGRCHRVRWPVGNSKSLSQEAAFRSLGICIAFYQGCYGDATDAGFRTSVSGTGSTGVRSSKARWIRSLQGAGRGGYLRGCLRSGAGCIYPRVLFAA
ncbi:hypothetical protein B375_0211280 [Xylella fastidiosa 6c]|nr:hypothetical protein ADT30_01440 [Xylella fastidiosa]OJZ69367.1 hypothetical protein B375_0211280 [Xylella fastidiosa 6c]